MKDALGGVIYSDTSDVQSNVIARLLDAKHRQIDPGQSTKGALRLTTEPCQLAPDIGRKHQISNGTETKQAFGGPLPARDSGPWACLCSRPSCGAPGE